MSRDASSRIDAKKLTNYAMLAIIGIPLVVLAVYALTIYKVNAKEDSYVALVNGEPIAVRQFRQASLLHRANVINEFTKKYGVDGSGDFWNMTFDGITPASLLKERTLQGMLRGKVIQIAAKEQGLVLDINYSSFLDEWEQENERRERASAKGEVMYGPIQYSEHDYEVYVLNNLELRLQERLAGALSKATEKELIALYEEQKDELFHKGRRIKVMNIYIPYSIEKLAISKPEAKAKADEVIERLEAGESFESLVAEYNEGSFKSERIFDADTERNDMKYDAELRLVAEKLKIGQISDVIDYSNYSTQGAGFFIMKSVEKIDQGVRPFSEVRGEVIAAYTKMKYLAYIDAMVDEAKVEVNSTVYDCIRME